MLTAEDIFYLLSMIYKDSSWVTVKILLQIKFECTESMLYGKIFILSISCIILVIWVIKRQTVIYLLINKIVQQQQHKFLTLLFYSSLNQIINTSCHDGLCVVIPIYLSYTEASNSLIIKPVIAALSRYQLYKG